MAKIEHNIIEVNPESFSNLDYLSQENENLLEPVEVLSTFIPGDKFIELTYFSLSGERLSTIQNYTNYSVLTGDTINNEKGTKEVSIDVLKDFKQYNSETSEVVALYNFLDYSYSNTNTTEDFYIESISPDRTELRLVSVNLQGNKVLEYTNDLISKKNNSPYALEVFLYQGNNTFFPIVNIDIETFRNTYGVLVKLSNPLPQNISTKSRLNIVEKVSESVAYRVIPNIIQEKEKVPTLRSANFDVDIETQSTEPSEYYSYNELFSFPTNNTNRELNSLFREKGIQLSIDYSDYTNFVNFSSAEERVLNFKYKLDLIESYQTSLDSINTTAGVYTSTGVSGSREYYESLIKGILDNFDHYERHLFYESGSSSWPKSNTVKPYINKTSSDTESITWFNNQRQIANIYDAKNSDILTNTTPAFIKEDIVNEPYNLFINMVGQHFDNIWIYVDALSKKYNADNRLNRGVSKDLVEDLLKNFGVKLYTSNRSTTDLYRYFTVDSYDLDGEILTEGIVSGSNNTPVSQDTYQKEVYKRLYHNLPLLMKSKGTERGLRALITCFGIPSDILKIKVYGGQSVNDLPFYGGEQEFTSSLDKVRLNNTGTTVEGNTLSFYTSINKKSNDITQDLHRIEVGFSPADNINSYIVSQSAVLFPTSTFNIDDYIGDPRDTTTNSYTDLDNYRDTILTNLDRYDIKDFVRLIKFFDNIIFRMIRDFIPARVVADTGVIIKSHLLERNKTIPPVLSWTNPTYSGSINTAFISGSNARAFDSVGSGNINKQSRTDYTRFIQTPNGIRGKRDKRHQEPRFDGEFQGTVLKITNGELNDENPFKVIDYDTIIYSASFYEFLPAEACDLPTTPLPTQSFNAAVDSISNYNLGTLFGNPDGIYEYSVDGQGIEPPYLYNFTPAPYTQYDEFLVEAQNTASFVDCESSRGVKVIYCNLGQTDQIPYNGLSPLAPNQDLTTWWQSTGANGFPSHDPSQIRYEITNDGITQTYTPAQVQTFDFSGFTEGDIDIKIYDDNLPNGEFCFTEFTISFEECILTAGATGLGPTVPNFFAPLAPPLYVEPFNFNGTETSTTTYYVKLEYGNNAESDWIELTKDIPVGEPGEGKKYIPAGNLAQIFDPTDGYPSLNNITTGNINGYTTFLGAIAYEGISQTDITMRIKAENSNSCIATKKGPNIVASLQKVTPPTVYTINFNYKSTQVSGNPCCLLGSQTVYSLYPSQDFEILSTNSPLIYSDYELTSNAPSGWYKIQNAINDETVGYWNGANGSWSQFEDCNDVPCVD